MSKAKNKIRSGRQCSRTVRNGKFAELEAMLQEQQAINDKACTEVARTGMEQVKLYAKFRRQVRQLVSTAHWPTRILLTRPRVKSCCKGSKQRSTSSESPRT